MSFVTDILESKYEKIGDDDSYVLSFAEYETLVNGTHTIVLKSVKEDSLFYKLTDDESARIKVSHRLIREDSPRELSVEEEIDLLQQVENMKVSSKAAQDENKEEFDYKDKLDLGIG